MSINERRLRKLERHVQKTEPPRNNFHLVFVHPGDDAKAKIARLTDYDAGDEICCVHFVRPGDAAAH